MSFDKDNIDKVHLERFAKSVKRFSDKKRRSNNGLERRSDPIRSKCALTEKLRLKKIVLQTNETRIIYPNRGFLAVIYMLLGAVMFSFSITLILRIFMFNSKFEIWGYGILAVLFIVTLLGIIIFLRGFRNILGKSKPIIILTPDGFIMPKGNRFIAWDLVAAYGVVVVEHFYYSIVFKVAQSVEDKNKFLRRKTTLFNGLFDKSIQRVYADSLGFDGYSAITMRELLGSYIEGAKARKRLAALDIDINR